MNTKRIAVIGAGIFGSEIAITLRQSGYEVKLFEKSFKILSGATENSQNRLHLGLHYPRDLQTAIQSVRGYESFVRRFETCVDMSFENYYALAKDNSKITLPEFSKFTDKAKILVTKVEKDYLEEFGLNPQKIDGLWRCTEGVIDFVTLREQLISEMESIGINLSLRNEVLDIDSNSYSLIVESELDGPEEFDFVIRSTYGTDRLKLNRFQQKRKIYEFHHTLILKAATSMSRKGLTVIDGDFITLLPSGKSTKSLLYSPTGSVRDKHIGTEYPVSWDLTKSKQFDLSSEKILEKFSVWLPQLSISPKVERLITVRSIEPNVQKTDRRTSSVTRISQNIIDIWSGKIDHCVDIANQVKLDVEEYFNVQ
jgi:hypothetical protein